MKKRGWTKYGAKIKVQVVKEYLETECSLIDLERKYGINRGTIYYWVKQERQMQEAMNEKTGNEES